MNDKTSKLSFYRIACCPPNQSLFDKERSPSGSSAKSASPNRANKLFLRHLLRQSQGYGTGKIDFSLGIENITECFFDRFS